MVLLMEYHSAGVLIYVEVVSDGAEVPKLHRQRWKELDGSPGQLMSGKATLTGTLAVELAQTRIASIRHEVFE